MAITNFMSALRASKSLKTVNINNELLSRRMAITTRSGAILPEPRPQPFGIVGVVFGVVFGVLIGATISKNIANFLEENDLFVPSDDDDDD
ncbi:essential MCU regulator, mitochondrial [Aphidius gifuensis]|uniref:essential MCU regulator, mitochondrial n=1 Tax=Aphidius gifuensis TaxID=684658 RepID=UPI001CDC3386|nr:essential MCU regulator, mitochondrial [Aphidius gifuensis]XP_044015426.1 essential MCU regulator, mitochondrial [Aphidius gifuensis]